MRCSVRRQRLQHHRVAAAVLLAFTLTMPAAFTASVMAAMSAAAQSPDSPDQLFEMRERDPVQRAAALWRARLARNPGDAEAAWKLARALYWLGANSTAPREARRPVLEDGMAVARRAIAIAPAAAHGHFWLAANMGMLAELFGRREGLRYRTDIKHALETTLAADPGYLHGAAQRALGRWYATVPSMFGGDRAAGEVLLRAALSAQPDSAITKVLLAELLLDTARQAEARALLSSALAAPPDPDWAPEDLRFKARAQDLLGARAKPPR